MKNNKYKIVVLSDLKETTETTLKSAIDLGKAIGGDVHFFHVKKPTDVVDRDSQLSTFRTINEQHTLTKNAIDALIKSASKTHQLDIDYSYTFGNVKNEIQDFLNKHQPDIVVLGKRKSTSMRLPADGVIKFVLKEHKGPVLVVGNQNILEAGKPLLAGVLNDNGQLNKDAVTNNLLEHAEKPLKAFRFIEKGNKGGNEESSLDDHTVNYVFERNDNTINNLSKYLSKSSVNLLCLNRNSNENNREGLIKSDIKDIINKLDVSVLLSSRST